MGCTNLFNCIDTKAVRRTFSPRAVLCRAGSFKAHLPFSLPPKYLFRLDVSWLFPYKGLIVLLTRLDRLSAIENTVRQVHCLPDQSWITSPQTSIFFFLPSLQLYRCFPTLSFSCICYCLYSKYCTTPTTKHNYHRQTASVVVITAPLADNCVDI